MTFEMFKEMAFSAAKELACESAELFQLRQENVEVQILEGELDGYSVSAEGGVNLRVVLGGKNGYAYTEVLDDPKELVARAIDNAAAIESTDERPMQAPCQYPFVKQPEFAGTKLTEQELIDLAKSLEIKAKAADSRCIRVGYCLAAKGKSQIRLCNTLGLDITWESGDGQYIVEPILKDGDTMKNAFAWRGGNEFSDVEGCVKEAIEEAADKFGAAPVASGKYKVIFRNTAMSELLSAFSPMFSAEVAQKKLSLLADKEGEVIAAPCISITDDPFDMRNPRPFDGEGVPSVKTAVVTNGVLNTLLHDLKSAKKANCASTSNGGRGGAAGAVTVMPSNFFIESGQDDFDTLVKGLGDGIVITDIAGTHAGLSTVSGDFSLMSSGYLVKDGKKVRSVEQITAAGNFLTLLKNIEAVGSDLRFGIPNGAMIGAPSVLISEIMISGE